MGPLFVLLFHSGQSLPIVPLLPYSSYHYMQGLVNDHLTCYHIFKKKYLLGEDIVVRLSSFGHVDEGAEDEQEGGVDGMGDEQAVASPQHVQHEDCH